MAIVQRTVGNDLDRCLGGIGFLPGVLMMDCSSISDLSPTSFKLTEVEGKIDSSDYLNFSFAKEPSHL